MAEFRHQVPGVSDEVESVELYLPDDTDSGTGEVTMNLKPDSLSSSKAFWSTIIHPPKLQVLATVDANMIAGVQLGLHETLDRKNFRIPEPAEPGEKHKIRFNFSNWKLTDAFLDDELMEVV